MALLFLFDKIQFIIIIIIKLKSIPIDPEQLFPGNHTLQSYSNFIFSLTYLVPPIWILVSTYVNQNVGLQMFDGSSRARKQAAAAYWHQHCVHIRNLLYDLQAHRPLAGHNVGVIIPR